MDDSISASDFTSAEASISSEPAESAAAPVESSAPVTETAQPEGATTAPAVEPTAENLSTEPVRTGPIPFDVHKTALENARAKAVTEYQQKYGWAEQVNPQEFQQIRQIAQHFQSGDVVGGLQAMIAEARKDPSVDAQIRSFAARELGRRSQPTPAQEQEPQPDLPIQLEDGRVVHLFSAEQQAKREAFLHKQWLQSVQQEIQPLKQSHEAQQKATEAANFERAWGQWQTQTVTEATSWEGMENPQVRESFAREVEKNIMGRDIQTVAQIEREIDRAYRKVVVPSLRTASRQAVLNDINRQANASTVNPAHTSTRAPRSMDDMSIAEALQHVAAQSA
jgi:hypothetical protein